MSQNQLVEYSKSTIKKGSKSFALASFFFGSKQKEGAWLLYSWCRYSDDLIDKAPNKKEALIRLENLISKTKICFKKNPTSEELEKLDTPELLGLHQVAKEFQVPEKYALDLLRGMEMDLTDYHYQNLSDLLDYCYCVAGTVGLMMCHIMGVSHTKALDHAVAMGNAMQLTNISRDVLEDRSLGRIYFPAIWLNELNLTKENFSDKENRMKWVHLTRQLLAEAQKNYHYGNKGLIYLPFRAAIAVAIASAVYKRIGEKVLSRGANAWDERCYVTLSEKVFISILIIIKVSIRMVPRIFRPWKPQPIESLWSNS